MGKVKEGHGMIFQMRNMENEAHIRADTLNTDIRGAHTHTHTHTQE